MNMPKGRADGRSRAVFRLARFLARTEIRVLLAALILAGACIGIGGAIADRLVILRLLAGAGGRSVFDSH